MSEPIVVDTSSSDSSPPLNFTDAAAQKVGQLIEQEGNSALKLRVYVQGGGCSGFQYGFTFDEETQEGDTEIENGGVTLLVDPMSVQYLMGAEIDYREDLSGAQFIIRNPNASTTCGCGSSFSVCRPLASAGGLCPSRSQPPPSIPRGSWPP